MSRNEGKNNCHSRTFLAGIQKIGCPTKAFGHDNFILLDAVPTVHNISDLDRDQQKKMKRIAIVVA
jgi:hypothetical protein